MAGASFTDLAASFAELAAFLRWAPFALCKSDWSRTTFCASSNFFSTACLHEHASSYRQCLSCHRNLTT